MSSGGPTRQSDSLADVVEMLLDKGVVINADIVVSIGDTELLGVQLRAAIASFETAAEYGLEFPEGTDMRRVENASGRSALPEEDDDEETVQTALEGATDAISDEAGSSGSDADAEDSDDDEHDDPGIRARPGGVSEGSEGSDAESDAAEDSDDDD